MKPDSNVLQSTGPLSSLAVTNRLERRLLHGNSPLRVATILGFGLLRGSHAKYFILRLTHGHRYCFCGTALAWSDSRTPFPCHCPRDSGRDCDRSICAQLGQGRCPNIYPLGAWTRLPSFS